MHLSNTQIDLYNSCPFKWKLYYQDKIRSEYLASPLFFGGAIDHALNILLLSKKKELTNEELVFLKDKDPEKIFLASMSFIEINGVLTDIRQFEKISYYKSDFDADLMSDDIANIVSEFATTLEFDIDTKDKVISFMDECFEIRKAKQYLPLDSQKVHNYICWLSLVEKGKLMIEAYKEQVLPEIVEVHSIQRKVELPDDRGNMFIGYIDFEATLQDGKIYIIDNKTASAKYKEDSVRTSQQLSIYSEYAENPNCAYFVVLKKLKKKAPYIDTQIVKDTMPEDRISITFDTIENVLDGINNNYFEKNEKSCFAYGKKCDYYNYCRSEGKELEGLICLKGKK